MFLKIAKEKVKYVAILNGEPILIKIENLTSDGDTMTVKTGMFVESEYTANSSAKRGHIVGVNNTFVVDPTESAEGHYDTVAIKLIKDKLIADLGLVEGDFEILAEAEWKHAPQTIRLTIPVQEAIENSFYRGLIDTLISNGTIYYKVGDNYILYLSYIDAAHRPTLEADPNIIIEE
jgi:hypothetical protein